MNATTRKTAWDSAREAIRKEYPLPADLARLRSLATFDLWHGPMAEGFRDEGDEGEPWPGFVEACQRLRAWADDVLPRTVWYDNDCGHVGTSEPEAWHDEETDEWHEPFTEETYRLEWREILAAVFPSKLSEYL